MTTPSFTILQAGKLVEGVNTISMPQGAQLLSIDPTGTLRVLADPTAPQVQRLIAVLRVGAQFPWTRCGPAFHQGAMQFTPGTGAPVYVDVFDGGEVIPSSDERTET